MKISRQDHNVIDNSFAEEVFKICKENVYLCYQCRKCTSGCPVHAHMDFTPFELIRLVQLGMTEKIEKANTIWVCASCQTCTSRCPQGIDIAHIIDVIRILVQKKRIGKGKNIWSFNSLWMRMLKQTGRIYEPGLILLYNLFRGKPFNDLALGFKMIKKNKLKLWPSLIKPATVRKIFSRAKRLK